MGSLPPVQHKSLSAPFQLLAILIVVLRNINNCSRKNAPPYTPCPRPRTSADFTKGISAMGSRSHGQHCWVAIRSSRRAHRRCSDRNVMDAFTAVSQSNLQAGFGQTFVRAIFHRLADRVDGVASSRSRRLLVPSSL